MSFPRGWIPVLMLVTFASPTLAAGEALSPALDPAPERVEPVATAPQTPPPRILNLVAQTHHPKDWLYVTTTSERFRLRADRIGPAGLDGLHAYGQPAPPSPIGWDRIRSIDRRHSRFHSGALLGTVVGSIVLGYTGAGLAGAVGHNDAGAFAGIAAGAVLGAWVGARIGDRLEHTTPLYDARGLGSPPGTLGPTPAPAFTTVDIARVRDATRPASILRVRGPFGEAIGRAASIDEEGLHGMNPDPRFDTALPPPPDPIPWSSVWRLQRRGSAARRGATIGAVLLGVGAGSLAAAIAASGIGLSAGGGDTAGAFFGGGAVGALVGAGIGGLIGSVFPVWHSVPGVTLEVPPNR